MDSLRLTKNLDHSFHILFVDDNEDLRNLMKETLQIKDWKVLLASGGREAIDYIQSNRNIHAIVSDYNMPDMDGAAFNHTLQEMNVHIPFILYTGDLESIPMSILENLELYTALEKPTNLELLISYLEEISEAHF